MPDQDIFKDDKTINKDGDKLITDEPVPKPDDKPTDQLLAKIVNEDGTQKYNTVEEVLSASIHAQAHIKTLESENATLKEKGNASDKLDELLTAVKQSQESGNDGDKPVSTMKPEDVLTIVKDYFDDNKAAETRTGNINTVTKIFKDRYGKDASEKLYSKANDLGFSDTEINSMIANNPNAVLKVLGENVKQERKQDIITNNSSVNTSQFNSEPNDKPVSVMGLTTSKELVDAFEASKQRTLKRLGIEET